MSGPAIRGRVAALMERLHDETTAFFTGLDRGGRFREDRWDRPGGGGGVARVLSEGATFEKAGINRSAVSGVLPPGAAQRLGCAGDGDGGAAVLRDRREPRDPSRGARWCPTVHLNVRYFDLTSPAGETLDVWLGGGTDLTPTYPFPEDAVHFHRALKAICDRHHPSFYPRFKSWCDHYFVNTHRGDERRGIGGVFFDNLRDGRQRARPGAAGGVPAGRGRGAARGLRADRRAAARTCPMASASAGSSSPGAGGTSSSTWCTTGEPCSGCRPTPGSRAC